MAKSGLVIPDLRSGTNTPHSFDYDTEDLPEESTSLLGSSVDVARYGAEEERLGTSREDTGT